MSFTEENYENAIIQLFTSIGYTHIYAPDINRDYHSPIYTDMLKISLTNLNPNIPTDGIDDAIYKLTNFETAPLIQKNQLFMQYIQNGINVKFCIDGQDRTELVYLIDYNNINNNSFHVINQWTVIENSEKRPDIILFINGLPLVVIELKSPSREETNASEAYRQIKNNMKEIPVLFIYNIACVMSDQLTNKIGTLTSDENRYMEWKTKDGKYENNKHAQFDTFFEGLFIKDRFLDIIKNFCCYASNGTNQNKILAGYHQYFAVKKAVDSTVHAVDNDQKGGVFWHTQGSGKSLSMVFYAHLLQEALNSPTIIVLTDRNDLDNQLYLQFSKCKDFLRQDPQQAENREGLKKLLNNRIANGIIFTTMQKFEESDEPLSTRKNIVVISDEAHRGQYGLKEEVGKDGKIKIGFARIIRNSLPNATYIGFTGTPISMNDRSTREVFGDYIDIYDMTQAVEDGATRPVYYESRVINLKLDTGTMDKIDQQYDEFAQTTDDYTIEKSKKELSKMDALLGAEQTINSLVDDILSHYENNRQNLLTGKAIIVAYSRPIAMKIYERILELRPAWDKKVNVVMTSANGDPEEWREIIGNNTHKEKLATKFKDNNDDMKIAIVVDMWLTGFDVPSLSTMYIYKPMAGHTLMQAIARVNRVFEDKEGGLIVDYIGIASALNQAMSDYTNRDKSNYGNTDIKEEAYPKFLEKLSVCREIFHSLNYNNFIEATDIERAKIITDALNFITDISQEENKKTFIKEALLLKQALSLCSSIVDRDKRVEAAFFEAVRTLVVRLSNEGGNGKAFSLKDINESINNLLKQSIKSDGVINLFTEIDKEFSLFDPIYLDQLSKIEHKNIAVELLKKLVAEKVKLYSKTNLVKSEKFSDKMQRILISYHNGMLTNEQVIDKLIRMAEEMNTENAMGKKLGLTGDELAFYDALTKPEAIKDFYENEQLVEITKKLTDMLRDNRTIDWERKESARAGMRKMIKRLLKKYKYPPEGIDDAMDTIIRQCELWTDN